MSLIFFEINQYTLFNILPVHVTALSLLGTNICMYLLTPVTHRFMQAPVSIYVYMQIGYIGLIHLSMVYFNMITTIVLLLYFGTFTAQELLPEMV